MYWPMHISSSFLCLVLTVFTRLGLAQMSNGCPREYVSHDDSCYSFVLDKARTFQEAAISCDHQGSTLISIDSTSEHQFVSNWLSRHDPNRHVWLTSGVRSNGQLKWTSDQSDIITEFFVSEDTKNQKRRDAFNNIIFNIIVYKYSSINQKFMWDLGRIMVLSPYICELKKSGVWKFYQRTRDFDYGTGITDPAAWPRGPNITSQSKDTVFVEQSGGATTAFSLECIATGNPFPTYRWFIEKPGRPSVEIRSSSRHSISNGRMTFSKPDAERDVGSYTCLAENVHGKVMSSPVRVSVGQMGEFSNVQTGETRAPMYTGVEIACNPPIHKPDARYNWFKNSVMNFVRPQYNRHTFISRNGMLYISEVSAPDAGDYYCMVVLAAREGETLATLQPPARTSMPIRLVVQGENANTYGPDIQDKFPQVFPTVPIIGKRMEIECFAYGRLPLRYSWQRLDGPMNPTAYTKNHGRVLVFDEARLEDTGSYSCTVVGQTTRSKTVQISMSGAPLFPYHLKNQFIDESQPFTWKCISIGVPPPTYTWYKDGVKLSSRDESLGISVRRNILMFDRINGKKHNGIYQCEASNNLGTTRSGAQLRAVAFAPSFARSPVRSTVRAAEGGNVTIQCQPEAAPMADISWLRDGGALGGNARVMPNGALELSQLKISDSSTYTCEATNSLGSDASSCEVEVKEGTSFVDKPKDDTVTVNSTISLPCQASYSNELGDVVYVWRLNDRLIDFQLEQAYSMPSEAKGDGTLYIVGAQFKHEGIYTCHVTSVVDQVSGSGYIDVAGPPGEPGGVHAHELSPNERTVELWWQRGKRHVFPISRYIVQAKSEFDDQWTSFKIGLTNEETKINIEGYSEWRGVLINEGLSPGTSYSFRVISGTNEMGYGPPSMPSSLYRMDSAPPIYAPDNVGGGGGSEGELHMSWDPLPRSQWGSDAISYIVYYRLKDGRSNKRWIPSLEVSNTEYHTTVSTDLFYMPYEVKVQARNNKGHGPNSTVVIVYSAELMPTITPLFSNAYAINGTAGVIQWQPVDNTRENVRGSIFAFQINYWLEDPRCSGRNEDNYLFIRFYGNVNEGTIIGLQEGGDYCFTLQLLNHAGRGPKTDYYGVSMYDLTSMDYPEWVSVQSHGPDSVRVYFRGVSSNFGEDPLRGYNAWWWDVRDDVRSANKTDLGRYTSGVIHGLKHDVIYKLRVVPYNNAGEGKKSSTVVMFTLGGTVLYNPATTEVMNSSPPGVWPPSCTILLLVICLAPRLVWSNVRIW